MFKLGYFKFCKSMFDLLLSQIRTHAIRRAHENIDRTLKAAEVILSQFDLTRQVGLLILPAFNWISLKSVLLINSNIPLFGVPLIHANLENYLNY